jgi:hypothetical protein
LVALDNRPYRFAMQPYHHLVRLTHILSISAFFGAICLVDLRLIDLRSGRFKPMPPLRALADMAMPWIYGAFGVAMLTGVLLFFYDPVHVASHAYFSLKMILIALGVVNAMIFNRKGFIMALNSAGPMPRHARIIGGLSLILWLGVMICACLNVEAEPKVLLR